MSYRIGDLAKTLGVSEHTLRFYEKEGLIVSDRDKNNIRFYSEENKLWTEFLLHMKETGMALKDLKRYTELNKLGNRGVDELLEILVKHREKVMEKLEAYQSNLNLLNNKINLYQSNLNENDMKDLYESFVEEKNEKDHK
jgi:DNA-binding transcriptional MerR regulator